MRSILSVCLLSIALAMSAFATTYTQSITAQASVTIPQTTHGITGNFAVILTDSTGAMLPLNSYQFGWDSSQTITITFPTNPWTGTVTLRGNTFGSADTTASTDFKVSTGGGGNIYVCAACTSSAYARRTLTGTSLTFVLDQTGTVTYLESGGGVATIYVWISPDGILHAGTTMSSSYALFSSSHGAGRVAFHYGISGFPAGCDTVSGPDVVQLATIAVSTRGALSTVTDKRPPSFQ